MYGTFCTYVRYSISFSVVGGTLKTSGSARSTTSPSSSSTRRSTPCAAGCCGPKLIAWLSISTVLRPGVCCSTPSGRMRWSDSGLRLSSCASPWATPGATSGMTVSAMSSALRVSRPGGRRAFGGAREVHLLVARQRGHAFPRREEVERPPVLRHLDRFVDDFLAVLVVAALDIAGQREVLAHRMAGEAVVGQDAAQVGLAGKHDPEQVPRLALPPRGGGPDLVHRCDRGALVGLHHDAQAVVQRHRQQVVDDVETLRPLGPVDAAEVHHLLEGGARIVAQREHRLRHRVALHLRDQLAPLDPRRGDAGHAGDDVAQ